MFPLSLVFSGLSLCNSNKSLGKCQIMPLEIFVVTLTPLGPFIKDVINQVRERGLPKDDFTINKPYLVKVMKKRDERGSKSF